MTNRPPKGDGSEGFNTNLTIFLDFNQFWSIFLRKSYFIYGKWAGNTQGMSRIYLEVVSALKSVLKSQFWVSKLDFLVLDLYFDCVDLYILGFGLVFWVLNSYLGVWT